MASNQSPLQIADQRFLLHPFTNHEDLHNQGTQIIVSGSGVFVEDARGRRLLDGLAGLWCVNVGYGRSEIIDAVASQMRGIAFYPSFFNTTTEPPIRLAARLAEIAPPRINRTFFSNSGSEANETALKMIRAYWVLKKQSRRTKIFSRDFSYHGVTLATTSMTGLPTCNEPFNLPLPDFLFAPAPYVYAADRCADGEAYGRECIAATSRMIEEAGPENIAAFFVEPIQGAGGVIPPPPGYLTALRALCREHQILFVADEVITGFGRLGDMLASNLWDLDPDIITLAKGLTSGYLPLGATMISEELWEAIVSGGYFAHGFTYSGHPVTCAAALANLDIIEREGLVPRVKSNIGPYFQEKLRSFAGHPAVGDVRGVNLIGALELLPRGGKEARTANSTLGMKAAALVREEGSIVRGIRDIIALAPPLVISRDEVDQLFETVGTALDRLWE